MRAASRKYGAALFLSAAVGICLCTRAAQVCDEKGLWPPITATCKPWAYWWWMGSAVDPANLRRELERYKEAGLGGLHVIPIYGAQGYEKRYVRYLSDKWLRLLRFAIEQADRLGLQVDMTLGTGWCYGGPWITKQLGNQAVKFEVVRIKGPTLLQRPLHPGLQALVAYGAKGEFLDLTERASAGALVWKVPSGTWELYEVWEESSGRRVKRAAPGGEGYMLNLLYTPAIKRHLERFEQAFASYSGKFPRAFYHDSYEYNTNWAPDFFLQFKKRRGYDLKRYLRELFTGKPGEISARVKADWRRTASELIEESLRLWVDWAGGRGVLTRNQAHGSPGNLLDLYALADIPETEMFHNDRDELVAKFASSAAHVTGRRLVASETGTWLRDHFLVRLADLKDLVDQLFVSGVNHVIYHGTCYSPDDAPWPGWLFYASTQMNPRNSIWRDAPFLNRYIARVQAVLQNSEPDNDILLYWPVDDLWHAPGRLARHLTVHDTRWLTEQPIGAVARALWERGYAFDYVSGKQLRNARFEDGRIRLPGASYRLILLPPCTYMPEETFRKLLALAEKGAQIAFVKRAPEGPPGLRGAGGKSGLFSGMLGELDWKEKTKGVREAAFGRGRLLLGEEIEMILSAGGVRRESIVDNRGVFFIRKRHQTGCYYFITNRSSALGEPVEVDGWVKLARSFRAAAIMDPATGEIGRAWVQPRSDGGGVYLQLPAGRSLIVKTSSKPFDGLAPWPYFREGSKAVELRGPWKVRFICGGPVLPEARTITKLKSWTEWAGPEGKRFAGTARYSIRFTLPEERVPAWRLDLGRVAESARVFVNGRLVAGLFSPPFKCTLKAAELKKGDNLLEIEVTNLSSNRIRDLDLRGVKWKVFHDINFVDIRYRPFDASGRPILPSGLLGPVVLKALQAASSN